MHRLLICVLAIVAACYRPRAEGACEVRCDLANAPACPAGLTCGADGLCYDGIPCDRVDAGDDADGPPRDEAVITSDCVQTLLLGMVCPTSFATTLTYPPTSQIETDVACGEILTTPDGEYCLFAAENIVVNTQIVRVTGTRPLVLFGRSTIAINVQGSFDLQNGGAGMSLTCNTQAGRDQQSTGESAGGGAGGTMIATGGDGGIATGYPAAPASAPVPITTLRGGCPGGAGGRNVNSAGGGVAGLGGGAIQLISPGTVIVRGAINAYGAGGGGAMAGGTAAGGGGGGSGGLIAIDATAIEIGANAVLSAHGGGGGGGAAATGTGMGGADGAGTTGAAALGGSGMGGANNGKGGNGSSDSVRSGENGGLTAGAGAGAGGGGGAAGAIILRAVEPLAIETGAQIHPPHGPTP